MSQKPRPLV